MTEFINKRICCTPTWSHMEEEIFFGHKLDDWRSLHCHPSPDCSIPTMYMQKLHHPLDIPSLGFCFFVVVIFQMNNRTYFWHNTQSWLSQSVLKMGQVVFGSCRYCTRYTQRNIYYKIVNPAIFGRGLPSIIASYLGQLWPPFLSIWQKCWEWNYSMVILKNILIRFFNCPPL